MTLQAEGEDMMQSQEPVAWVAVFDGKADGYFVWADKGRAMEWSSSRGGVPIAPLYLSCPYITGNVTRYCTLTPFTLTDEEREAIEQSIDAANGMAPAEPWAVATLRGLLERTQCRTEIR
jgi:hypothetical protein